MNPTNPDWYDIMVDELYSKGLSPYDGKPESIDIMTAHVIAEIDRSVMAELLAEENESLRLHQRN